MAETTSKLIHPRDEATLRNHQAHWLTEGILQSPNVNKCLRLDGRLADTTTLVAIAFLAEFLCEFASFANLRSLPVEEVDRHDNDTRQAAQHGTRVLDMPLVADVVVHRRGIHRRDTSQKITSKGVATTSGG